MLRLTALAFSVGRQYLPNNLNRIVTALALCLLLLLVTLKGTLQALMLKNTDEAIENNPQTRSSWGIPREEMVGCT